MPAVPVTILHKTIHKGPLCYTMICQKRLEVDDNSESYCLVLLAAGQAVESLMDNLDLVAF